MKTKEISGNSLPPEEDRVNQRVTEASALRILFQEQWQQLRNRIQRREAFRIREKRVKQELNEAVELMVTGTDGRMRAVSRYQKRLRHSTHCLLNYIAESIQQLPPAIAANRQGFYNDSSLQRLFNGYQELDQLFSESRILQQFLANPAAPDPDAAYALLICSSHEQTGFGCEMQGEMILRDAIQATLTFSSHRILTVAASEIEVRNALKRILFESVVGYLRDYMTRLHHDQLTPAERSELPGRGEGIEDPRRYLEVLEWLLSLPLNLLRIHSERLNLDRIGVVHSNDSNHGTDQLRLDELTIGDRPSQVICMLQITP